MPLVNNVNELDQRISFQSKKRKKDENGDYVEILETVGECWGKLKAQLLKEYQAAIGTILEDTVTFIIRSYQIFEIDHTMTLNYKGKDYEIIKSMPDATSKEYQAIIARLKE